MEIGLPASGEPPASPRAPQASVSLEGFLEGGRLKDLTFVDVIVQGFLQSDGHNSGSGLVGPQEMRG